MAYYALKKDVFDKSKITVVGSPTITSDGVASGFANGNRIQIPYTIQNTTNFTIKGSFTFPTTIDTSEQHIVLGLAKSGSDTFLLEYRVISGNIGGLLYSNGENSHGMLSYNLANSLPAIPNKTYDYKIIVNGTNITLDVEGVIKTANDFYPAVNTSFYVGCDRNGNNPFDGSINLPSFKITVGGQLIYTPTKPAYLLERRKEGYDPSKFTIVGSPTITEYGVASGFSNSKYLTLDTSFNMGSQPWNIDLEVITGDSIGAYGVLSFNSFSSNVGLVLSGNTNSFSIRGGNQIDSSLKVKPNSKYSISFGFDGTNAFLTVNGIKNTVTNNYTIDVTKIFIGEYFGQYYWSVPNSSINLPSISITVYGKEVFTGAKEVYYAMEK